MIAASPKHRIFLAVNPIDFRCGIDRIVSLCLRQFQHDSMLGHYFIFCNKRQTSIKLLYYDSQGFCLFQKRLSCGRFNFWPKVSSPLVTLTSAQLQVLLFNGDPANTREGIAWSSVC